MGAPGFGGQWGCGGDREWRHHPHGAWGSWGWEGGRRGHQGPPPWLAGLFGLAQDARQRGPRVRRGDVRAAILDVLATGPMNGYQIIQQIAERSGGAWRPSPGSVYPTVAQLEDEGFVEQDDAAGRRTLRLTADGEAYVADRADELAAVWAPFETVVDDEPDYADLKPEIGRVMSAVWQIVTSGTERQRREAIGVLVDTRRRLYAILAEEDAE